MSRGRRTSATPEQISEIRRLGRVRAEAKRWTQKAIARHVGVGLGVVAYHLRAPRRQP